MALMPLSASAQEGLTLSQAIQIGLENNFNIKIATSNLEAAQENNTWGVAGGMPLISINGSANTNTDLNGNAVDVSTASVSADVSWTLFKGFNIKATKSLLESDEQMAEGNQMISIENTIQSIITSYYYVLLQQEMLKVNRTIVEISEDRFEREESLRSSGASGTYEYVLAQSNLLNDKSTLMNQEVTVRDAIRSLNLLLSLPAQTQWILTESLETPNESYSFDSMLDKLLDDNRTLQNQYITLKARDYEIQQSRSSLYPTIGLNASIATADPNFNISNNNYIRPQVGLTFSYYLFSGGPTRRNVAKIRRETEQLATEQLTLELTNELASQFDDYNVYRELVVLNNQQLEVAQTLLSISEERYYEYRSIDAFDLRDIQLSYLQSATTRLNSIYNLVVANTQLLRLTGGLIDYTSTK